MSNKTAEKGSIQDSTVPRKSYWERVDDEQKAFERRFIRIVFTVITLIMSLWFILSVASDYSYLHLNDSRYANDWIVVPADHLALTEEYGGMLAGGSRTTEYLTADYTYRYQNKQYRGSRVTEVVTPIYELNTEAIRMKLSTQNQVYIRPKHPETAVLLPRQLYLQSNPQDPTEMMRKWMVWMVCLYMMLLGWMNKNRSMNATSSNVLECSYTFRRLLACYWDVVAYLLVANFLLCLHGNLYYFSRLTPPIWWFDVFLWLGLPMMILIQWLLWGKTVGMQLTNLRILQIDTMSKPDYRQILKRFSVLLLCLATLGLPMLFFMWCRNKQQLAKITSGTVVVKQI